MPSTVIILPSAPKNAPLSAESLKPVKKNGRATAIDSTAGLINIFFTPKYFLSRVIIAHTSVQPMRFIDRKYIIE